MPGLAAFRAGVALDALIWLLLVRWIARACWLRSRRARERLKQAVDDARSRARPAGAGPQAAPETVPPLPFALLGALSVAVSLGFGLRRWADAGAVFRADGLKRCMDACLREASARFYQQGEARVPLANQACVRALAGRMAFSAQGSGGELRVLAVEDTASDYLGDGVAGNQGLSLDAYGHFRKADPARERASPP
jgi:hypothetical protein